MNWALAKIEKELVVEKDPLEFYKRLASIYSEYSSAMSNLLGTIQSDSRILSSISDENLVIDLNNPTKSRLEEIYFKYVVK